jgi:signal transduction histidine kinase/DNA-binding response OmpR family regulator
LLLVTIVGVLLTKNTTQEAARKTLSFSFKQKSDQINNYFNDLAVHSLTKAELEVSVSMIRQLTEAWSKSKLPLEEFVQSSQYKDVISGRENMIRSILQYNRAYDLFLISPEKEIIYTSRKENDLGKNLDEGFMKSTLLSKLINSLNSNERTGISDIAPYKPSDNRAFFFISTMLGDGNSQGYIALQLSLDTLNSLLFGVNSLAKSSAAYILQEDMRIVASSDPQDPALSLFTKVNNPLALHALAETGGNSKEYKSGKGLEEYKSHYGTKVLGECDVLKLLSKQGQKYFLVQEVSADEAYGSTSAINAVMVTLIIFIMAFVIAVSMILTRRIVVPINHLADWAGRVARGDLAYRQVKTRNDEIGRVNEGFKSVVDSFRELSDVAGSMAVGDFEKELKVKGPEDVLGNSVNQMLASFRSVVEQARRISEGDFSGDLKPRSPKDSLGIALQVMTRKLRESAAETGRQDWLKSGLAELSLKLSGDQTLFDLAHSLIRFLVGYLDAQMGLVYLSDEKKELVLTATFAYHDRKGNFSRLKPGEGLVGQAAIEREIIYFNDIRDGAPALNYGVGEKIPSYFAIAPMEFENNLLGVIQIGKMEEFSVMHRLFIEQVMGPVAVAINTSVSRNKVRKLLEQTQEQADKLQVQQEELRQTNEELEEQTKALRASEEALQAQQEELRVINEELHERSKALEDQRDDIRRKNEELTKARNEIEEKAKALEIASRYKSEFLANMSHELRTPLNSIIVLSQLLSENKKENLNPKQIEYARTINSSGSDLLDLINEILDLSKIEAGRVDLHPESIDLRDMLSQLESFFRPLVEKKGLDLRVDIAEDLPATIYTDAQKLQQILRNLLSNALKFTEKGSIALDVRKSTLSDPAGNRQPGNMSVIAITVKDTGIGIPKEKMKIIFEAFQQADGTTSRRFGGTGLGLTISRSFAQLMGGDILLSSEEGNGSKFTLLLPERYDGGSIPTTEVSQRIVSVPSETASPKYPGPETDSSIEVRPVLNDNPCNDDRESVNHGDKVLLVVEDDQAFARTLYDLSAENGFKCLVANDGEGGLYLADLYVPSAIVLDIGLPGIDGWEVMNRLRQNARTRHIPVHFISAQDMSRQALQLGAIGFLTKPASVESLRSVFGQIEKVISRPMKKLLIVEDDRITQKSIIGLIGNGDVTTTAVATGREAIEILEKEDFDCMILDLGLEDMSGYNVIEKVREIPRLTNLPVIIYTGSELTREEEEKLQKYADSIIIKGIRSPERLLSETSLFLHRVEANLPKEKQAMIRMLYSQDDVFHGKTLLLVDDDSRNVFAIASVLEERGLKVIPASNGVEGIEKLKANKEIDLILMDVMMPEMDGYEAIGIIRKMKEYENLPIIALTAKAMKDDRDLCIGAGANDYLAKPVDSQKLLSLLRVWLYK